MIRGIGGIFIYADDAEALTAWYTRHLGIEFQFEPSERSCYRDFLLPPDTAYGRTEREVFAIRQAETKRTDPARRFVINLRVQDLQALLLRLQQTGVAISRSETYDYGHFAWIEDPEGNLLELFEPT